MKQVRGEGFSVRFMRRPTAVKNVRKEQEQIKAPEIKSVRVPVKYADLVKAQEPDMDIPEQQTTQTSSPIANQKLWEASRKGDCPAIRMAVMDGADIDSRDMDGRTAINIATQYNQHDALKTLLAAKEMKRMAALGDLPNTKFFQKITGKTAEINKSRII